MKKPFGRISKLVAATAVVALAATACGSGSGDEDGDDKTITLGIIPSWTDGLSTAHLWEAILEDEGYEVEIEEINDAAALYTAVANGDYDVYPSAWPEVTHASYMDKYGDDLEDLGAYYDNAKLTLAVPEYTDIDSIAELNDNAERFDGRIVGIEAGAGLTGITKDKAIPAYDLADNFELIESSTTAMLAELRKAISDKEDIVVTLWRPFWPYAEFPIKDLEDPEGAMGESETLNAIANKDFSGEFSDVAEWMGNFKLDDQQYGELEDLVVNQNPDDPGAGARAWLDANPDFVDSLKG